MNHPYSETELAAVRAAVRYWVPEALYGKKEVKAALDDTAVEILDTLTMLRWKSRLAEQEKRMPDALVAYYVPRGYYPQQDPTFYEYWDLSRF